MFIYTAQYPQVYLRGTISVRRAPARFAQFSGYGDTPADGPGKNRDGPVPSTSATWRRPERSRNTSIRAYSHSRRATRLRAGSGRPRPITSGSGGQAVTWSGCHKAVCGGCPGVSVGALRTRWDTFQAAGPLRRRSELGGCGGCQGEQHRGPRRHGWLLSRGPGAAHDTIPPR